MPLVPPASDALAAVPDPAVKKVSMLKDMMQPVAADGQLMGAAVTGLPATLKNIRSLPPLLNSVIGEQVDMAVEIVGTRIVAVSMTPVSTAVYHIALNALAPTEWVPHAYKNPLPFPEVL
jgi:hypothetical protein